MDAPATPAHQLAIVPVANIASLAIRQVTPKTKVRTTTTATSSGIRLLNFFQKGLVFGVSSLILILVRPCDSRLIASQQ